VPDLAQTLSAAEAAARSTPPQGTVTLPAALHGRLLGVYRLALAEWKAYRALLVVEQTHENTLAGRERYWKARRVHHAAYEALHAAVAARPPAAETETAALADHAAAAASRPIHDPDAWARRLAADLAEGQD
jgi:hypothetical protein